MRLVVFLFALSLVLCAVVAASLAVPEVPGGHGLPHPEIESMEHAPAGHPRVVRVLALGWAFGVAQVAFFTGLLALGARAGEGLRGLRPWLVVGGVVYGAVWTLLVLAYRGYALGEPPVYVLGFPAPTALMLFALFPVPWIFVLLYVAGFERWIASPADLARLERRLAELRTNGEERP